MTPVSISDPEEMDALELDMRMRLAELQRRYKDKQRELSRLQNPKRARWVSITAPGDLCFAPMVTASGEHVHLRFRLCFSSELMSGSFIMLSIRVRTCTVTSAIRRGLRKSVLYHFCGIMKFSDS
jgi:hypothetical protein